MSVFLSIAAALAVIVLALEMRRRAKKRLVARSARGRGEPRPAAGGLALDRSRRGGSRRRDQGGASPSLASPILLGLVILLLAGWLVAAYLAPERAPAPSAAPAPPENITTLAGRLTPEPAPADQRPDLMAQAARNAGAAAVNQAGAPAAPSSGQPPAAAPSTVPLTEAALAVGAAAPSRQLGQVGLLPSQAGGAAAPSPATGRSAAGPSAAAQPSAAVSRPAAPPPAAAPPLPPASPPGGSAPNAATAAAVPPPAPRGESSAGSGILAGQGQFTVHLGSFSDRDNAERYKTKLATAGEMAFISEITVDGRLWYRVMSGRFDSRASADAHGRDLKRRDLTVDTGRYLVKPVE